MVTVKRCKQKHENNSITDFRKGESVLPDLSWPNKDYEQNFQNIMDISKRNELKKTFVYFCDVYLCSVHNLRLVNYDHFYNTNNNNNNVN